MTFLPASIQRALEKPGLRLVLLLAAIVWSGLLVLAINRYYCLLYYYDQGLFNQVFWNSIRGNLFQGSLTSGNSSSVLFEGKIPFVSYSHFGQHFVPDFIFWLPLYALFPSNITLIALQVTLIVAAGLVLYAIARHYLEPPLSVAIVASYYAASAVISPTLANFYEACQIPLFMFGVILAFEQQRWRLFWLMVALTLGIREDTGVILFGLGSYLIWSRRHWRIGVALCSLSFAYIVVVTTVVMPLFSTDSSKLYLGTYFSQFVQTKEPTTLEVLWGILTHPIALLKSLFLPLDRRITYFFQQWLPLAFVPILSTPAWIMTSFPLVEILLQQKSRAVVTHLHYAWAVIPGLFYGTILWWSQHPHPLRSRFKKFWVGCIALSVLIIVLSNSNQAFSFMIPDSIVPWYSYGSLTRRWEHAAIVRSLIQSMPADASIAGTGYLIPDLSSRRAVVGLPIMQWRDQGEAVDVDYAIADFITAKPYDRALKERSRLKTVVDVIDRALEQKRYGLIELTDRIAVIQRGKASNPDALKAWATLRAEVRSVFNKRTEDS